LGDFSDEKNPKRACFLVAYVVQAETKGVIEGADIIDSLAGGSGAVIRVFGHYVDVPALFLAAVELTILFLLVVSVGPILVRFGLPLGSIDIVLLAEIITVITAIGLLAVGLYNREHLLQWGDVRARAFMLIPGLTVVLASLFWGYERWTAVPAGDSSVLLCLASMVLFLLVFLGVRWVFVEVVDKTHVFRRRVAVIGAGSRAAKIEKLCNEHLDRSFSIVGYIRLTAKSPAEGDTTSERRSAARRRDYWLLPTELLAFCTQHKIQELVIAARERRGLPVKDLVACKLAGVSISEYATFWERESRQIDLDEINPSWLVLSDGFRVGQVRSFVKRTFDIVVSLVLLTVTLPITILTAVLIKLESRGPVFFRQDRVGLNGTTYRILKFRSMRQDAEKDGPRWAAKNDARVTRVGAVIRKVRIDEIPQVINVLKGEMAFVGPRPERPVFVEALAEKIPYYMERHSIKPGITGWAQINYPYGATEEDARMKLSYDLYYAKNGNIFLDILILIQTVKVLLWNSGAR